MLKGLPRLIWLVSLLVTIILGVMLGILLPQNTFDTGITLAAGCLLWLYLPFSFHPGNVTTTPWFFWPAFFYCPFVMLMASVGTYWALRRSTWGMGQALLFVILLMCVSILVCIPVSLIAPSLSSHGISSFDGTVTLVPFVCFHLSYSTLLGWCIGCLIPRGKCKGDLPVTEAPSSDA